MPYYFTIFLIWFFLASIEARALKPTDISQEQIQNNKEAAQSQKKVSLMADQAQNLSQQHSQTLKEIENTKTYNEQMRKMLVSQREEKKSIRFQIREVKHTDKQILPFLLEMLEALEEFMRLDLPFLKAKREGRLLELKALMDRADISTSEKYRKIMEAYKIENEYGRTIEAYQGLQNIDGKKQSVEFLRIGRLSLLYQTLDGKKQAYFSMEEKKWIPISSSREVSEALRMAKKLSAPRLITAWLKAPETAPPALKEEPPSNKASDPAKTEDKKEEGP